MHPSEIKKIQKTTKNKSKKSYKKEKKKEGPQKPMWRNILLVPRFVVVPPDPACLKN